MNTVISNGVLITMDSTKAVYEKGMIVINNDTISYAGEENNTLIPPNSKVIDAKGGTLHATGTLTKTGTGDLKGLLQRCKATLLCAVASASQDRRYQSLLYLHPSSPFLFSSHLFPQIDKGVRYLFPLHTFFVKKKKC